MKRRFGAVAFVENIAADAGEDGDLTLESLRQAFAALDGEPSNDPENDFEGSAEEHDFSPEIEAESEETTDPSKPDEDDEDGDSSGIVDGSSLSESDSVELNPKNIVEAMLFVGDRENRPLSPGRAAEKMRNVTPEEIEPIVDSLNDDYRRLGCPYTIVKENDGYRMVLRPEFGPILEKFFGRIREARLSQQAVDTLAIVAYQQPITSEGVQKIRRQPSSALLSQLVRRGLLEATREQVDRKKVVFYRTTDRFLELFQLETIDDLPMAEEIDFR